MKTTINRRTMLRKHASAFRSLAGMIILSFGVWIPATSQAVKIENYIRAKTTGPNINTGYSTDLWEAAIIGFRSTGEGDIDTGGAGPMMLMRMYNNSGIWYISADIRSHNYHEGWSVDVMFVRKGFTNASGIHPATSGNVGIGTTSPAEKLAVQGNIYSSGSIYSGGNLGIGTIIPKKTLHVNGDIYARGHVWLHAFQGDGNSGTAFLQARDDSGASDIGLMIRSQSAGSVVNAIKIDPNGNVGIGTTIPAEKLAVQGNIHSSGSIYSDGSVGVGTTSPTEKLTVEGNISASGNISSNGHVSIGAAYDSVYSLKVNGDVYANTFVTSAASFPDYVFEESYELMPLEKVKTYIRENRRLPGMPSEAEVIENGADLGRINTLLVEKVEELTLYAIALKEELERIKEEIQN